MLVTLYRYCTSCNYSYILGLPMTSNQKKREPWRNENRYYCAACNIWCDNNRQSILIHENGKKHKEAVAKSLEQRRRDQMKEEQDLKFLQSSLVKMEQVAMQSHLQNDTALLVKDRPVSRRPPNDEKQMCVLAPPSVSSSSNKGKKEWSSRKRQRSGEKQIDIETELEQRNQQRKKITGNEGSYQINDSIFLEGPTYSEILEEDMPIEIWTGPTASLGEKRLIDREAHWKKGIITAIRKTAKTTKLQVVYLSSPDNKEETKESNVAVDRIRILLGSDEKIPDTIGEARLLAMGGEEIKVEEEESAAIITETGFSGWSTIAIKRSSNLQEEKEERNRLREERKRLALKKEAQEKESEMRRMEAAKAANADDSALGAFDALGTGDYRGIEIHQEAEITVADTAKRLAKGSVAFKKKKKNSSSKRRIRQTSAD